MRSQPTQKEDLNFIKGYLMIIQIMFRLIKFVIYMEFFHLFFPNRILSLYNEVATIFVGESYKNRYISYRKEKKSNIS